MSDIKESLRVLFTIITLGLISIIAGFSIRFIENSSNKELPVSLPEEIAIAKAGDVLEVYTVSDSIYVKFKHKENSDSPVIIWNDDPESIPMDGELVKLEFTENDTLYISNP
jgi:hypothetical protein